VKNAGLIQIKTARANRGMIVCVSVIKETKP